MSDPLPCLKVSYESSAAALDCCPSGLRVYRCFCGKWHRTKLTPRARARDQEVSPVDGAEIRVIRHVFKVVCADGSVAEVEKYAESRADALTLVRVWVALHWRGARVEGEPAYDAHLTERSAP